MFQNIDLNPVNTGDTRSAYVLDTNVLLHDPSSLFRFEEHFVLIPLLVLDEIDSKKKDPAIGYNARDISTKLEQLLLRAESPDQGIPIPNGKEGLLYFTESIFAKNFPSELSMTYKDNAILSQIIGLKEIFPQRHFILVSKDRNMRIKAGALNIPAQDYLHDKISEEYPQLNIIDNSAGLDLIENQEHDQGHGHHHGFIEPHTWMSPENVKIIARSIYEALLKFDNQNENHRITSIFCFKSHFNQQ